MISFNLQKDRNEIYVNDELISVYNDTEIISFIYFLGAADQQAGLVNTKNYRSTNELKNIVINFKKSFNEPGSINSDNHAGNISNFDDIVSI